MIVNLDVSNKKKILKTPPIMLALCSMLWHTYYAQNYAQNYAGMIGSGLTITAPASHLSLSKLPPCNKIEQSSSELLIFTWGQSGKEDKFITVLHYH